MKKIREFYIRETAIKYQKQYKDRTVEFYYEAVDSITYRKYNLIVLMMAIFESTPRYLVRKVKEKISK